MVFQAEFQEGRALFKKNLHLRHEETEGLMVNAWHSQDLPLGVS
jgi:hypothetical protein